VREGKESISEGKGSEGNRGQEVCVHKAGGFLSQQGRAGQEGREKRGNKGGGKLTK